MLFISRLVNESILIGENIEVKVTFIEGGSVCMGIQAPREIPVSRKETLKKIKAMVRRGTLDPQSKNDF